MSKGRRKNGRNAFYGLISNIERSGVDDVPDFVQKRYSIQKLKLRFFCNYELAILLSADSSCGGV